MRPGRPVAMGTRNCLVKNGLDRAQDSLILAFREDHAPGRPAGGLEDRPKQEAGSVYEARQLLLVGRNVGQRSPGYAASHGCFGHGRRQRSEQPRVERAREEIVAAEFQVVVVIGAGDLLAGTLPCQACQGIDAGKLHGRVDGGGAYIQRSPENEREAQDVVDLVRDIAAARADDGVRAVCLRRFRVDFRVRVGKRQDERVGGHALALLGRKNARPRKSEEDVRPVDHVIQCALLGLLCEGGLVLVRLPSRMHQPVDVAQPDVLPPDTDFEQQVEAGDAGGSAAGRDQFHVGRVLAHQARPVHHRGGYDDCGSMLVVMQYWNAHFLTEPVLDNEAIRGLDVLEIDGAEGWLQAANGICEGVRVALVDLDVEHVDVREPLEQDCLALHHRLGGEGADVSEPEHRGTIRNDSDQIATCRVPCCASRVLHDRVAGFGDAGRVGEREVALVCQRLGGSDCQFSRASGFVILERFLFHHRATLLLW